jgi:MFS superfamily sulfate permease-like transporter
VTTTSTTRRKCWPTSREIKEDAAEPRPRVVALSLADSHELDVETADVLAEFADALARDDVELRLAEVRAPVLELLGRSGLAGRVRVDPTLESAVA